ncbi:putative sodium-dependent phosphate transporter [Fasciolopsis buskii]|uniref:Putative sodium-dependent phosphate transporter n=1 Tax=Fasciolopsis buskii TaxID=27845 RepID=A0A8E0RN83_9TREM|nr:putative sodium-dependent phosphate transporter [Fasciolopsis buski]
MFQPNKSTRPASFFKRLFFNGDESSRVWRVTFLCCMANFINAADRVIMPLAINPIADHFKWNMHTHGWVLSAFSVGYLSSMILGGSVASRYGGSVVLMTAVLLWSVSSFVTPWFAFSSSTIIALRFLLGVGEGIGLPTTVQIISKMVPLEERSRALGYLVAFGSLGQIVATLIFPHWRWEMSFYLYGMAGFVWIICWLLFLRDFQHCSLPEEEFCSQQSRHGVRWYEFISHGPLWAIYVAHFSMNWSSYIVMQWLPTYLVRFLRAKLEDVVLTALPYLSNCIASIAAGHIADHFIQRQWSVLAVRRLMTGIGLAGPGILMFLFSSYTTTYSAICNGITILLSLYINQLMTVGSLFCFLGPFCALRNLTLTASNILHADVSVITVCMMLSAFNSAGHLSNHVEVAPNHAGITFAISNTLATIPGILCGPMTAELVVQSEGRWFPVFFIAGCVNLVGAVVYVNQSSSVQVL